MTIEIQSLTLSYDENLILSNCNLRLTEGEILVILGASGCGKTTLLRAIAGFVKPDSGSIHLNGRSLVEFQPEERNIGMLFQRPVLFPHKDVLGNILFAYRRKKDRNMEDVNQIMRDMGIYEMKNQPIETLSGGEAQRVVLARALLTNPELLLLDEPLSSLDLDVRRQLASEIRTTLKSKGIAAIHVTHDHEEAAIIGDRIIEWNELHLLESE
ncbi:ABC transporter ATP-binding protein [Candidatus Poseidoniales archaeon]|nr:ABC transporter ATP-binding protein [Candidatus Poseidoniales archaeon]MDB2366844.1 ABC transporter ATP-binding protein [Candidatus Poseidoniales archaeon]MDB2540510.1 ABC transporter ATP-binding protein [Candidatus Poseidoniales archaeon]|tara:strand:+ start:2196 stop:2834 length:639 start_codon:yes stop_codon:yes gene_type:complete